MEKILGIKDPSDFKTKRIRIRKQGDSYDLMPSGEDLSFAEMMEYRKPVSTDQMFSNMENQGHVSANLGAANYLTLEFEGQDYLIGTRRMREEFGDFVFGLIGGYVHSRDLANPIIAAHEEISEELLPCLSYGGLIRFSFAGEYLEQPFAKHFRNYPFSCELREPSRYNLQHGTKKVLIEGKPIVGKPVLFFEAERNCTMLMFNYHLNFNNLDLSRLEVSLHNAEDTFNIEKGLIEAKLNPPGILLMELEQGNLTDKIFSLNKGGLEPFSFSSLDLCEAYNVKGIMAKESKVPLEKALARC